MATLVLDSFAEKSQGVRVGALPSHLCHAEV
jgi:hypothetical protein